MTERQRQMFWGYFVGRRRTRFTKSKCFSQGENFFFYPFYLVTSFESNSFIYFLWKLCAYPSVPTSIICLAMVSLKSDIKNPENNSSNVYGCHTHNNQVLVYFSSVLWSKSMYITSLKATVPSHLAQILQMHVPVFFFRVIILFSLLPWWLKASAIFQQFFLPHLNSWGLTGGKCLRINRDATKASD